MKRIICPTITATISLTPTRTPTLTPTVTPTSGLEPSLTPTPTVTPTPTITPSSSPAEAATGECYMYTLDYGVSTSFYGVSYKPVGSQFYVNNQFNSIPSENGANDTQIYHICSEEAPTLLDTYNWPTYYAIGGANGITYSGPSGTCETNFDCYGYGE